MFFKKLLEHYKDIKFPPEYTEVTKIDKSISWYLSDSTNQFISVNKLPNINILELDISQAFTTICKCIFDKDSDFINKMNHIKDKKSRNIFIATSLVNTEYLRMLNLISKIVITGTLFEIGDITLLELKKDGATICCNDETLQKIVNLNNNIYGNFTNFIISNNFKFHTNQYDKYIRSNKTSYFLIDKNITIKGIYKHSPEYIKEIQYKILLSDFDNKELKKIYSTDYYKIIINNHLNELINKYYLCDNKKFIDSEMKYISSINNISVNTYLRLFIYPLILSTKV
ncbi:hypothetical protein M0P25_03750 [archaeon]|nr:hypothetical protein [archaeon]MCK9439392.1 hypothetical protein [Patescibacteria group bacterium]